MPACLFIFNICFNSRWPAIHVAKRVMARCCVASINAKRFVIRKNAVTANYYRTPSLRARVAERQLWRANEKSAPTRCPFAKIHVANRWNAANQMLRTHVKVNAIKVRVRRVPVKRL